MSDLISRQAAVNAVRCYFREQLEHVATVIIDGEECYAPKPANEIFEHNKLLSVRIKQLPSALPEIIKCKDCKHYSLEVGDESYALGYCPFIQSHLVMSKGFCAWAERRSESEPEPPKIQERIDCPVRHKENGNCLPIGGFCTAVPEYLCKALRSAYERGKADAEAYIFHCGDTDEPMTHYDEIRSMSVEEMAKWFINLEVKILNIQPMLDRPALEKDWLEWLQKDCNLHA